MDCVLFRNGLAATAGLMFILLAPQVLAQIQNPGKGPPEHVIERFKGIPGRGNIPAPEMTSKQPEDDGAVPIDSEEGFALGRTVVLSGLRLEGYESYLRISNLRQTSGAAHIRIHDAATGAELAAWDSDPVPASGAIEVGFADIADGDLPSVVTVAVTADFAGQVQHLAWFNGSGVLADVTACSRLEVPKRGLGYVAGPGRTDTAGFMRLLNAGTMPHAVTLDLHDAATGAVLGSWASPEIPAMGSVEIGIGELAAAAMPPVAATVTALTISAAPPVKHIQLSYLEGPMGGAVTDLTAGCALKGGADNDDAEDDDASEDDDSDDAESEGSDDETSEGDEDSSDPAT